MFAIFDQTLLTDTGKALVHDHETGFDAQKVYAKTVKFYLKSTKASLLDSSNLLSYITCLSWLWNVEGLYIQFHPPWARPGPFV